jgi:hypothetical protein
VSRLAAIRVPKAMKLGKIDEDKGSVVARGDFVEYEVSNEVKKFWDSLSERERETLCNISLKQNKDLREVLSEQM